MSFPTWVRLVILTAEHVYSGCPGDRLRVHGLLRSEITQLTCYLLLIQCLTGATETCFTLLTIFVSKRCGQNNWSFGDYAVRRPFLAKFYANPLERFVPSNAYMTHPTPLPTWCECRVWLGRCSACDNNYTKPCRLYLQDCQRSLCQCLQQQFNNGLFTIRRNSAIFWSGTWTDMTIEQCLMKFGKTVGDLSMLLIKTQPVWSGCF